VSGLAPAESLAQNCVLRTDLGSLYHCDCMELLPALADASVDLWFADPPFNLAKDYGDGVIDRLGTADYLAWMRAWLLEGVRLLRPGGSLFVFNLPRWNVEAGHVLNEAGLLFRHWIAIDIKYSLPIAGRLHPAHYSLLYYSKGRPARFSRPRIPVPVCRHCGGDIKDYGGHRDKLHPDGINLSDVWYDISPCATGPPSGGRRTSSPRSCWNGFWRSPPSRVTWCWIRSAVPGPRTPWRSGCTVTGSAWSSVIATPSYAG
jgi:hypothetical protein